MDTPAETELRAQLDHADVVLERVLAVVRIDGEIGHVSDLLCSVVLGEGPLAGGHAQGGGGLAGAAVGGGQDGVLEIR